MKFSLATITTLVAAVTAAPSWSDNKCGITDKTAKGLVDGCMPPIYLYCPLVY
jgi:hypothetical protein